MVAAMHIQNENDRTAFGLRTTELRNVAIGFAVAIALIMVAGQISDSGSASGSDTTELTDSSAKRFVAPNIYSTHVTAVDEDASYSYSVLANDQDGDTITLTCQSGCAGTFLSFTDNSGGSGTLSGTPDNDDVGTQSVTLRAADNNGEMSEDTFTITISQTNDAPTTGDQTISGTEDVVDMYASGDFTFADVDTSGSNTISHVKITTLESAGTLFVDADDDDTYDSGEDVTLNQEIAIGDITDLGFVGASNANGNGYATFSFKVKDGTDYSAAAGTNTINLAAVQDAPTTGDQTISATEDVTKMFASGDFTYSDVDSESISHVKITTLETSGTLFVDADNDDTYDGGEDVTLNQEIAIGDITNLGFIAAANANGATYTTFQFKVKDGTAYSTNAGTNTMNVAAVNDLPTTGDQTISGTEDVVDMYASGDFTYADAVEGSGISHVKITTLESAGTLFVDCLLYTSDAADE